MVIRKGKSPQKQVGKKLPAVPESVLKRRKKHETNVAEKAKKAARVSD